MSLIIEIGVEQLLDRYSFPSRLRSELVALIKGNLSKSLSATRVSLKRSSLKTQERRLYSIFRSIEEIREIGFKVESPHNLQGKHFDAVVKRWVTEGQSIGTMQTKLSHLKAFVSWMGKADLVKSLYEHVEKSELEALVGKRAYVTTTDKSWQAKGINAEEKIAEIMADDPYVGIQLKLQAAFGLRIEESFAMPIEQTIKDFLRRADGKFLVNKGTKGGRDRDVPEQLRMAVLTEALPYVNHRTGSTTPANHALRTWRRHYNHIMEKHGVTKSGLGVTSHGLRHQWLQEYYKTLTGFDAPIKMSDDRPPLDEHRRALQAAVEAVGHSKPSKTGMYISTYAAMDKLMAPIVGIEDVNRALRQTGGEVKAAAALLGISRQKLYRMKAKVEER